MCGIAGVLNLGDGLPPPELATLITMIGALRHRGPDEFGVYRDDRVGLGHARLSIIDLATGQQPLANEDDSLWVVFNGEIFNYVELRAELELLGHASAPEATPRSSSTRSRPGAKQASSASTASSRSRSGTRRRERSCWRATRWGSGRSTCASTRAGSTSRAR